MKLEFTRYSLVWEPGMVKLSEAESLIFMNRLVFTLVLVRWLMLPALAAEPPKGGADQRTVVILGDSLAAGYGLDPSEAFPAVLQKKLDEAGLQFTVVNAGISGDTSAGGLRRIDWLLKRRVDVLVLELGGNDGLRGIPVGTTRTNLQSIIDRTRQKHPQARVIIAGMQMPPNMGADYTAAFEKIFPELARSNNAALIPFLLEGVGGKPDLNLPDLIHPTADGQKIVADNVWAVLKPVIESASIQKPNRS